MASENNAVVGALATFIGYSGLQEGMVPILEPGMPVKIIRAEGEGDDLSYVVVHVDEDGDALDIKGGVWDNENPEAPAPRSDTVWPDEIKDIILSEEAAEESAVAPGAGEPEPEPEPVEKETVTAKAPTDFSAFKVSEMDKFAADNNVPVPVNWDKAVDGWKKMTVKDKKAHLEAWESGTLDMTTEDTKSTEVAEVVANATKAVSKTVTSAVTSVDRILAEMDPIAAAKHLAAQSAQTEHTLGGVLMHINDSGAYKTVGYEGKKGFEEFCSEHLGVMYRKAMYLMRNFDVAVKYGISEEDIRKMGWSKFKEISRLPSDVLDASISDLVEYAQNATRDDLIEHIQTSHVNAAAPERVKLTKFNFQTTEEDATTVTNAIAHAKTLIGEDNTNQALVHICGDWMNVAEGMDLDLDTFVALAIARFGKAEAMKALKAAEEPQAEEEPEAETADA